MVRSASAASSSSSSAALPRRRRKQVSLLLPPITAGQSLTDTSSGFLCTSGRFRCAAAIASIALAVLLHIAGSGAHKNQKQHDDNVIISSWNANMETLTGSSRPFQYIGDLDPSEPQPWHEEEEDWHALHETLVKRVEESDASAVNQVDNYLPQLIFYGDSITEGWNGTSFGNVPGPHRMWAAGEDESIRDVFANTFGDRSDWGKRALKPPLILGISGSKTYDFIWRVVNGEFPVSSLLDRAEETDNNGDDSVFQIEQLERIYIVLMGTNNLGGGMLPEPTLKGMDAACRAILQLHEKHFPNTPAAMLFSELLPRKDDFRAVKMCPPRCKNVEKLVPYKSFMPAINKVNSALPDLLDGLREDFKNSHIILLSANNDASKVGANKQNNKANHSYTRVINCGEEMFAFDDINESDVYMPDRLHPNAEGYKLWSRCLKKGLDVILTR